MVSLLFCETDDEVVVRKIEGTPEERRHLAELGIAVGGQITVIAANDGDLVISVKGARVALGREMARAILV